MTRQVRFYRQTPEGKQAVKPEEIRGLVSNTPKDSYAQILSAQGITYEVVEAGAQRPPTSQELPQIWDVLEKLGTQQTKPPAQQTPKPTTPTKKTTPETRYLDLRDDSETQAPATAKTTTGFRTTPRKPQTTQSIILKDGATLERELQAELELTPPMQEVEGRNPKARRVEERAKWLEGRARNPGLMDYILSIKYDFNMGEYKEHLKTHANE